MKRLIVLAGALGLLAAACGERGAESLGPASTADEPSAPVETASPEPTQEPVSEGDVTYEVWFASDSSVTGEAGDVITREGLFLTTRTQEATPAVGRAALTALLSGPTEEEAEAGLFSEIPEGTELLGLTVENGVAVVDLSEEFESGGGSATMFMRLSQVVYTLTQFPTVDGVEFEIEGRPVEVFSAEGILLEAPQNREDYLDQLPAILVESPLIGAEVSSPVTVAGLANVFEATVSIRILDEAGDEIARTFTTATCGTGCVGDYSKNVKYQISSEQSGTVEVFEASAIDGSPQNLVSIPVTLAP